MRRGVKSFCRTAFAGQARTFIGPNIAVTGYPRQTIDVTGSSGARSYLAWEAIVQPISQQSAEKYGPIGARADPNKTVDAAIDKADAVTYNTYPEGSVKARNDRFGKDVEEMLIGYPYTEEKYIKQYLKPRATDEYERRVKFYGAITIPRAICTFALKSTVVGLLLSFGPRADMKAAANAEVDIGFLEPGQMTVVMWQGKPVFIHRRTETQIEVAKKDNAADLKDPQADEDRCLNPEYAVMIAICTHLGCIPVFGAGDYNAYLCPCHGSHYDFSGRIRKGPAPLNLEVPAYYFIDDATLLIGSSSPQ